MKERRRRLMTKRVEKDRCCLVFNSQDCRTKSCKIALLIPHLDDAVQEAMLLSLLEKITCESKRHVR
jgi:hypothetical protein